MNIKNKLHVAALAFATLFAASLFAQTLTRGPYLQMGNDTEITVRWRTNTPTESRVRYGLTAALGSVESTPTAKYAHEIRLTNLDPNKKYFYSVGYGTNTLAGGSSCFFFTAPNSAKPTRIWVIGDAGTAAPNLPNQGPQANVRNAYETFTGSRHTDLWLMLGDNAYNNGTDEEYQDKVFDVYKTLLKKSVVWPALGNHDAVPPEDDGPYPYYDIFTLPKKHEAGGVTSNTEAYYSFDYGNIHFVCLDSEDNSRSPTGAMATWLEADLAANTKHWLIAFWHQPPYSKGSHDSDITPSAMQQMRANILPILEDHGVDLVLCGHSHAYERSKFINGHYGDSDTFDWSDMVVQSGNGRITATPTNPTAGAYRKPAPGHSPKAGTVYVVAGASGKLDTDDPQDPEDNLNHPAMLISARKLGSVVIDINNNRLDMEYRDSAGSRVDYFTIIKN